MSLVSNPSSLEHPSVPRAQQNASTLKCESYVLDMRPRYPLLVTAKRYWHPEHCSQDEDAVTFVCSHGGGFSKEHWEPTLDYLYAHLVGPQNRGGIKVREVWSVDAPNHGYAAVLNEEVLEWGYDRAYPWEDYARCIHAVICGFGGGVDLRGRKLVGLGHSMGANALSLADTFMPVIQFTSLIVVDPILLLRTPSDQPHLEIGTPLEKSMTAMALRRTSFWPSREDARTSLRRKCKGWDPRIVDIIVEHNIRPLPTRKYPDKLSGFTLNCPPEHEAACYRELLGRNRTYNYFRHLCEKLAVHIILGAINDALPDFVHHDIVSNASGGKHATVTKVAGAGHLVPQMQPRCLADAIWSALAHDASSTSRFNSRSKL